MSDPQSFCPFCKREHDAPEVLDYVKGLQDRLDRAESLLKAGKLVYELADVKAERDSLASRLDSAQKLAKAAWDAKSEGAMWQALSRIIDALEGTAVEKPLPNSQEKA